jgi:hypothetical protein
VIWHTRTGDTIGCPYGAPGDRLWVKETWAIDAEDVETARRRHEDVLLDACPVGPYYRATASDFDESSLRWRPSIHMPRWASRISLEVTGVRVERLQAISEADAVAEGVHYELGEVKPDSPNAHRISFSTLWDELNAKRAPWSSNPWVWVIEFRRVEAQERAA